MRQRNRALLLVGVLALAATGCELLVDFDRSLIDGGLPEDASAEGAADVQATPEASTADAGSDVTVEETGAETSAPDTSVPDTNVPDTNVVDSGIDSNAADTSTDAHDANVADTNTADTNVPDTSTADANDAGVDTGVDAGVDATVDAGVDAADAADAATACGAPSAAGLPQVTENATTSALPTFTGGTISDGTYALTDVTDYGAADAGATANTWQALLVITTVAGTINFQDDIIHNGTEGPTRGTIVPIAATTTLTATQTCPTAATPQTENYTVTSSVPPQLIIQIGTGGNQVWTLTPH